MMDSMVLDSFYSPSEKSKQPQGVADADERADGGGDDDDGGVDRRTSGDGHARLSEPSLVSLEKAGRRVTNIKNCPLYDPFTMTDWKFR
jgi:hypothetical protein